MIILNLLGLLICFSIVLSFIQNQYFKIVLAIVFSLFTCLEISSLYLGGSFIDYRYYVHFTLDVILPSIKGFKKQIALFFILFFLTIGILLFTSKKLCFKNKNYFSIKLLFVMSALGILLFSKNGIGSNLKQIYDIVFILDSKGFEEAKKDIERESALKIIDKKDLRVMGGGET